MRTYCDYQERQGLKLRHTNQTQLPYLQMKKLKASATWLYQGHR